MERGGERGGGRGREKLHWSLASGKNIQMPGVICHPNSFATLRCLNPSLTDHPGPSRPTRTPPCDEAAHCCRPVHDVLKSLKTTPFWRLGYNAPDSIKIPHVLHIYPHDINGPLHRTRPRLQKGIRLNVIEATPTHTEGTMPRSIQQVEGGLGQHAKPDSVKVKLPYSAGSLPRVGGKQRVRRGDGGDGGVKVGRLQRRVQTIFIIF